MAFDREQARRLEEIFMPTLVDRRKAFFGGDPVKRVRLAHYTSAENAVSILRSKTLWLRNSRGMEDLSEVHYGHALGYDYFADNGRAARFNSTFQRGDGNPAILGIGLYNQWKADLNFGTYVSCLSEHDFNCEPHGRLSMLRAFGKTVGGVALIVNVPEPLAAGPLICPLSPVLYPSTREEHWDELEKILRSVDANQEFIRSLPIDIVAGWVYSVLVMHAVAAKKPAFKEEREWRICHFPERLGSPYVTKQIKCIRGVPQVICELPLRNQPENEISGISLPDLIHGVKIGPTQHADVIWQALVMALQEAGVPDAAKKVEYPPVQLRG